MKDATAAAATTVTYVLLALAAAARSGERPSTTDVLKRALTLSAGRAGVAHYNHVRKKLDELCDRGDVEAHEHEHPRPRIEWTLTAQGKQRVVDVQQHFLSLIGETQAPFARATARRDER